MASIKGKKKAIVHSKKVQETSIVKTDPLQNKVRAGSLKAKDQG